MWAWAPHRSYKWLWLWAGRDQYTAGHKSIKYAELSVNLIFYFVSLLLLDHIWKSWIYYLYLEDKSMFLRLNWHQSKDIRQTFLFLVRKWFSRYPSQTHKKENNIISILNFILVTIYNFRFGKWDLVCIDTKHLTFPFFIWVWSFQQFSISGQCPDKISFKKYKNWLTYGCVLALSLCAAGFWEYQKI